MSVTFHIPGPLRPFTGGRGRVEIETSPATVRDAFETLSTVCPGICDRILTEQGQVREHISVFVGNEHIRYTGGLAAPLSTYAEISIVPAVSGGCEQVDNLALWGSQSWLPPAFSRRLEFLHF